MQHLRIATLLLFGMLWGGAKAARADYVFTTIDIGGLFTNTYPEGINDNGQIAGTYVSVSGQQGFFYTDGSFTVFDVAGANPSSTEAHGINASGQIVGHYSDSSGIHGFLYTDGSFTTIDVPGASPGTTQAWGINDRGQIVGSFGDHGFLDVGGSFTTIDVPGALVTNPYGINDIGQIVGQYGDGSSSNWHSFLYTDGSFTLFDVPGAIPGTTVTLKINDSGQIVGTYATGFGRGAVHHGFLYDGGSFTTIDVPGSVNTGLTAINDSGQIVGFGVHGFLATPQRPPSVSCLATPNTLWPPNGKSVVVTVSGTITSDTTIPPGGNTYAVIDEYGQVQPTGSITLSADGSYSFGVSLVASRNGNDQDGRTYTIVVSSRDTIGNNASCSAVVTVPHDQGK
jgi:probable HAF family extracellular repeat protein